MENETDQRKVALEFFKHHPLMTLSTISADGSPQTSAVYTYVDDEFNAYFISRDTTRKFSNIEVNQQATLSAHDENILMFGELAGRARVISNIEQGVMVLEKLQSIVSNRKSDYWIPPVAQLEGKQYVFFQIEPREVLFTNYAVTQEAVPEEPKSFSLRFD